MLYFQFFQIILIVICIIIAIIIIYNNNIEGFDEKVTDATYNNCGQMCTKILGCAGFAVDSEMNTCYLSKKPILGRPEESIFNMEYKNTMPRCNKIEPVTDPVIASNIALKKNATYICLPNGQEDKQTIKVIVNDEKEITNIKDLDNIHIDNYTFETIEWGNKGNSISLEDNKYLITNPTKDNTAIIMKKYDKEFLGQYAYPHGCVKDITQKDCMTDCINNKDCVGTDWSSIYLRKNKNNDTYEKYEGICCPMRNITKVVDRRNEYKYGNFYMKDVVIKDNITSENIII